MFIDMPILIRIKKHLNEKYWGFQLTNEFAFLMRYSAMGCLDKPQYDRSTCLLKRLDICQMGSVMSDV